MLVIRFFRVGKKNQPAFKIVVTDKRRPTRAGRFVEEVGFYNPLTKEKVLKQERIKYWLSVGAKPSATFHNLLVSEKIIEDKKIPKHKIIKKPSSASVPAEAVSTTSATKEAESEVEEVSDEKKEKLVSEEKEEPVPTN